MSVQIWNLIIFQLLDDVLLPPGPLCYGDTRIDLPTARHFMHYPRLVALHFIYYPWFVVRHFVHYPRFTCDSFIVTFKNNLHSCSDLGSNCLSYQEGLLFLTL